MKNVLFSTIIFLAAHYSEMSFAAAAPGCGEPAPTTIRAYESTLAMMKAGLVGSNDAAYHAKFLRPELIQMVGDDYQNITPGSYTYVRFLAFDPSKRTPDEIASGVSGEGSAESVENVVCMAGRWRVSRFELKKSTITITDNGEKFKAIVSIHDGGFIGNNTSLGQATDTFTAVGGHTFECSENRLLTTNLGVGGRAKLAFCTPGELSSSVNADLASQLSSSNMSVHIDTDNISCVPKNANTLPFDCKFDDYFSQAKAHGKVGYIFEATGIKNVKADSAQRFKRQNGALYALISSRYHYDRAANLKENGVLLDLFYHSGARVIGSVNFQQLKNSVLNKVEAIHTFFDGQPGANPKFGVSFNCSGSSFCNGTTIPQSNMWWKATGVVTALRQNGADLALTAANKTLLEGQRVKARNQAELFRPQFFILQ